MAGTRTHQERQVAYECLGDNIMCGFDEGYLCQKATTKRERSNAYTPTCVIMRQNRVPQALYGYIEIGA